MRIGIQTWGGAGDVRPMLALAGGLRAAGHEVAAAVTDCMGTDYSALCRQMDVRYLPTPPHPEVDVTAMTHHRHRRDPVELLRLMFELILFPFEDDLLEAARRLAAESDVVVGHFCVHQLKLAARLARVPHATVTFWPGFIATGSEPPIGGPRLGRRGNLFQWRALNSLVDRAIGPRTGRPWKAAGLRPPRHVMTDAWRSDRLNLLPVSPLLWHAPADWPPTVRMTGFLAMPEAAEPWEMPDALRAFLDAGEPPVFLSLGSPQRVGMREFTELLIAAARLAGCRAIIQTTLPARPPHSQEGDLYFLDRAPHHRLFPRCAAVVHHGGAGTSHSATHCGRPSIVAAFSNEQLSWGEQLHKAGVANRPMNVLRTRPKHLARAIRAVLDDRALRDRAEHAGRAMRAEHGVEAAVRAIEGAVAT